MAIIVEQGTDGLWRARFADCMFHRRGGTAEEALRSFCEAAAVNRLTLRLTNYEDGKQPGTRHRHRYVEPGDADR